MKTNERARLPTHKQAASLITSTPLSTVDYYCNAMFIIVAKQLFVLINIYYCKTKLLTCHCKSMFIIAQEQHCLHLEDNNNNGASYYCTAEQLGSFQFFILRPFQHVDSQLVSTKTANTLPKQPLSAHCSSPPPLISKSRVMVAKCRKIGICS